MQNLSLEIANELNRQFEDSAVFDISSSVWIEINRRIFFPILNTLEPINNQIRLSIHLRTYVI